MGVPLPLAVTMGEPAGIGPELAALAWERRSADVLPPFYCIADARFFRERLKAAGLATPICDIGDPGEAVATFQQGLPVLDLAASVAEGHAGRPSSADAAAVIGAIERGVADIHSGTARGLVTAPLQKETLYQSGFKFPGHTEYLGDLTAGWPGARRPVMMLVSAEMRVVPVTIHVPFADVPQLLSRELIVETGRILAADLASRFAIPSPRIAVAGLNPHAGEGGRIGTEERDIIAPAIEALRSEGIAASGPFPADTMFHPAARTQYDAALAMYHDQALIPIKTIAFDTAVNVTLGLPLVRTSPDHGTALALAGTGRANPSSFIAAIRLADEISRAG